MAAVVLLTPTTLAQGRDLFVLTAQTGSETASVGFSNAEDFFQHMGNAGLSQILPGYDPQAATALTLEVRGLPTVAYYPENSSTLLFTVPSLGIDLSFYGQTRDESKNAFRDFLKGEGESILTRLLRGLVAETPIDPVAGNPNSLVAGMAQADFSMPATATLSARTFDVGLAIGQSDASGFVTNQLAIPFQWKWTPRQDPRFIVVVDAPIRYLEVEGGRVYDLALGVGVDTLLLDRPEAPALRWSITPALRLGAVGSEDLGSFQTVYSAASTSKLQYARGDLLYSLDNMIGIYRTGRATGGHTGEYDVQNMIFKNGFAVEGSSPFKLLGDPTSWELQYVNTQITGDPWFIDNYNELVFTVGTRRGAGLEEWRLLRFGAKCTFADDFNAFELVLGYRF